MRLESEYGILPKNVSKLVDAYRPRANNLTFSDFEDIVTPKPDDIVTPPLLTVKDANMTPVRKYTPSQNMTVKKC